MFNWEEIAKRFFQYYSNLTQQEIAERFEATQTQVSAWKRGAEKIPLKHLEKMVSIEEEKGVTPEWLIFGIDKNPTPVETSGEQEVRDRAIKATFRLAAVLVELGQHLVDGKSLDDFSMPSGLQDILQSLKMRLQEKEELDKARNHRGA